MGAFRAVVIGDGTAPPIELAVGKPLALLLFLALVPGRRASREYLADLLWGDVDSERARASLRQTVFLLKRTFGEDVLFATSADLCLDPHLSCDAVELLQAVDASEPERAVALYRGRFAMGFAAPGALEWEHWAAGQRERLHDLFIRSSENLLVRWLAQARWKDAVVLARRIRDAAPERELSWRLYLESLLAAGEDLRSRAEADAFEREFSGAGRGLSAASLSIISRARMQGAAAPAESALQAELVERAREFEQLVSGWQSCRQGRSVHLHLESAAGFGKTRLLAELGKRLGGLGTRTVYLKCNPADARLSYSTTADVARLLAERPGAKGISSASATSLVALDPGLASVFSVPPDSSSGAEALRRRALALLDLVAALCREQPLALLLDDVQWLDDASRSVLLTILFRLQGQPVLLVTAARPSQLAPPAGPDSIFLSLRPLTAAGVDSLLRSLADLPGEPWAESLPASLTRETGGSPLLILETLKLALESGALARQAGRWVCPDKPALTALLQGGEALRRRLEELPRAGQDLVLLLAVAGHPVERSILLRAGTPGSEAALQRLEVMGLVEESLAGALPSHDAIAEASLGLVPPERLDQSRLRLALVLSSDPAATPERLRSAARLYCEAAEPEQASRLFPRWLTLAKRAGLRQSLPNAARNFVEGFGDETLIRRCLQALPFGSRLSRSRAIALGALLIAGLMLAGLFWLSRPYQLALLAEPLATAPLIPHPIIEVRDRLDRPVAGSPVSVTAEILEGAAVLRGETRVPTTRGRAEFNSLFLGSQPESSKWDSVRLAFTSPGLQRVTTGWIAYEGL
ncbi:MAG TPA: AAA family ATPase, partial [Gemmatimonadales bacterium]|nr:AAA family ATPase [Gemmatimonadales bacterium]